MASAELQKSLEGEEVAKSDGEAASGGELVYCGATQFDMIGRKGVPGGSNGNLVSPTRLRPLVGVDIRFVASGCASCHCVALDVEGRCYTWGRNEKGQLGHGDTVLRYLPTVVESLSNYKIVSASVGRNHTVVVTDEGKSLAFGHNKNGQLGTGSSRNEIEASPVLCLVSDATHVACGSEFTVWLTSVEGSSILTAGLPQFGQLGHGTDNEYNMKDSSVRLAYEAQPRPRPIVAFSEKKVVKVACGTNHTVAVDSSGFVYTWGNGGYGRLGHREQKDEWVPRLVEVFQKHNVLPSNAIISAGASNCACTAGGGQLYMWGKLKNTGDDWMYPKPLMDLSGWNIRCMASGNMHHVVGADDSCISWGFAQHGELGYGPLGQKSSANPKKVDLLEGMHVLSVGCGAGMSLIVIDKANASDRLDQLEVYDGAPLSEEIKDNEDNTPKKKGQSSSRNSASGKRKQSKDESDSGTDDEDEGEEEDGEEDVTNGDAGKGKRGGKAGQRGRGRGRNSGKPTSPQAKPQGRGRGRPKKSDSTTTSASTKGKPSKKGKAR
ncbi:regulator of chromosome condensation (RCC1) family protein [Carex rostrata]